MKQCHCSEKNKDNVNVYLQVVDPRKVETTVAARLFMLTLGNQDAPNVTQNDQVNLVLVEMLFC